MEVIIDRQSRLKRKTDKSHCSAKNTPIPLRKKIYVIRKRVGREQLYHIHVFMLPSEECI